MNMLSSVQIIFQFISSIEIKIFIMLTYQFLLAESTSIQEPLNLQALFVITSIIGGIIIITLIYVSFRKFKGEKEKHKNTKIKEVGKDN